jgi:hypothetical protein
LGIAIAVAVVVALALVAGIVALVIHLTRPTGPTQLHTADGLSALIANIRIRFGDTMGYDLKVYSDNADLDRVDPKNSRHKQDYLYRDGNWKSWSSSSSLASRDKLADLSKFDVAAVTATLNGAPKSLGITDVEVSYLDVQGAADGSLELSITVNGGGDNGYIDINPDGSVKQLHPPS